jgi:opacity protein-like surface antigen
VKTFRSKALTLGAVLMVALAAPAAAQWSPSYEAIKGMDESFRLDLGGFFQNFDTTVQRYKSDGTPGTEFNLGEIGGDENETTFRLDGMWRFGRHGNLQFGYRGWSNSNSRILDRDIEWGDTVYHVGAQVEHKLKQNVASLYYGYSFLNDGELEFGLMLGVSAYFNSLSLSASASVGGSGGGTTGASAADEENFVAPIPAFGGYFNFTLLPRFFVRARAKGLPKITISGYSASMVDALGGLEYFFTRNVGLGAGYEYTKLTFEHPVEDGIRITQSYSGFLGYLSIAF